mmetsp:Transcript_9809/g.24131  ORF Transcript_9809/g.24131 Transcript_9809/m.24131 type:complete len:292 (-) Transcript_9809:605-1480(-)|eukprot:CAMPEP_0114487586 /NCGR_PEP_ID=MMETSP0109-20121206/853_1 /TAXON_ID=29199 /ORGANISM="Chlorarachnion reptans, Strain CCCM449" /LENGTH=291 /DNA_ID=CAMNT_0001663877 /DNA_START=248 /DNA_END=1123 /DNA_ORIENTATION=-
MTPVFLLLALLLTKAVDGEKLRPNGNNLSSDTRQGNVDMVKPTHGNRDEVEIGKEESDSRQKRHRKDGSKKMESLEPERIMITEQKVQNRKFSRRGDTAKESEGLLAEYGLVFLISAGSLAVIAGSLLGLSIACNKSSKRGGVSRKVVTAPTNYARSCTGAAPRKKMIRPVETSMETLPHEKSFSFQALADSFVGSIRSMTSSLSGNVGKSGDADFEEFEAESEPVALDAEESAWAVYHTEEGIPYFYNPLTGRASWEPPNNTVLPSSFSSDSGSIYSMPPNTCTSKSSLP